MTLYYRIIRSLITAPPAIASTCSPRCDMMTSWPHVSTLPTSAMRGITALPSSGYSSVFTVTSTVSIYKATSPSKRSEASHRCAQSDAATLRPDMASGICCNIDAQKPFQFCAGQSVQRSTVQTPLQARNQKNPLIKQLASDTVAVTKTH